MKLVFAEQMRQLDKEVSKNFGIPAIILMENAGVGSVQAIMETYGELDGRSVLVVAGQGNNGGDGMVIARHILQRGGLPFVFLMTDPGKIKGAAAVNLKIIRSLNIPTYTITNDEQLQTLQNLLLECDLIIDAVLGIGLKRDLDNHFVKAIELINQANVPVVSVDIPSGLDSDSGLPRKICVKANLTTTYGLAKPGHFTGRGPEMCGIVVVVDIGIPPSAISAADLQIEVLENHSVGTLLPARSTTSHKGDYGHLMIIAGSKGKTGAAILCARGALRSGVGLATICAPLDLNQIYESASPETMTFPLSLSDQGFVSDKDHEIISAALKNKQALVIGPGLGQNIETGRLVSRLYSQQKIPMVIDADALNLLASTARFSNPPGIRILTPHPGEMARMTGMSVGEIQENRLEITRNFAVGHNVFIVLKGANTIIAGPDGHAAINVTGNPALAAGGSGDVLAGFIGSLLAQGQEPMAAASLGVYAHGLAADRLTNDNDIRFGLLASELADELPAIISELSSS